MCNTKRHCAINLHNLVKKICNDSTYVVVDDVVGNMLESLHSVFLIRGDDHTSLPKCLEVSQHRFEVLEESGFNMVSPIFRDACMDDLNNCGQSTVKVCQDLNLWKEAQNNGTFDD